MLSSAARSRSSDFARSRGAFARNAVAVLRQPLSDLLLSGGDDRLLMVGRSGINVYGCTPTPRSDVAEFASSTATTISKRAFDRAERAQTQLAERAESEGIETAFESRIEELRAELRATLRISEETEIVFAPSGTDGALFAVFLARALLGAPHSLRIDRTTFQHLHGARQFGDEG